MHPILRRDDPADGELIGDEPIPERRVVVMNIHRGVDQMRVVPLTIRDRIGFPSVKRLLGEAQHPASHRDRDPVTSKIADQRVHHFGLSP